MFPLGRTRKADPVRVSPTGQGAATWPLESRAAAARGMPAPAGYLAASAAQAARRIGAVRRAAAAGAPVAVTVMVVAATVVGPRRAAQAPGESARARLLEARPASDPEPDTDGLSSDSEAARGPGSLSGDYRD